MAVGCFLVPISVLFAFLGISHNLGSPRTFSAASAPLAASAPRRQLVPLGQCSYLVGLLCRFWFGVVGFGGVWRFFLFCVFCRKNRFFIKKTPKNIKKHRKRTKNNKKSLNRSVYSVSQPPPCGGVPSVVAVAARRPRCGGSLVQYYPTQPPRITCFLVRPCPSVLGKKP